MTESQTGIRGRKPIPRESPGRRFITVRLSNELHSLICLAAARDRVSNNQYVVNLIASATRSKREVAEK